MQKKRTTLVFSSILIVSLLSVNAYGFDITLIEGSSWGYFSPGEILVKFKEGISHEAMDEVHRRCKVSAWRQGYNNSYHISFFTPGRESEMIETYIKQPEVAYAELNYYRSICAVPNDEYYYLQWNFPLINLPDAWDVSTGEG